MKFSQTISVLDQCRVSPPSGSVSITPTHYQLTFMDLMWLLSHPVQELAFYGFHCSKTHFIHTLLPNLKTSLSISLQSFFPFASNLTCQTKSITTTKNKSSEISYLDSDFISLTICECGYNFQRIDEKESNEVYDVLVPQLLNTRDNKQFAVSALQVTLFPNNGICIGLAHHHNTTTAARNGILPQFMKSWASASWSQGDHTSFMANPSQYYLRRRVNGNKDNITAVPRNHILHSQKMLPTLIVNRLKRLIFTCVTGKDGELDDLGQLEVLGAKSREMPRKSIEYEGS